MKKKINYKVFSIAVLMLLSACSSTVNKKGLEVTSSYLTNQEVTVKNAEIVDFPDGKVARDEEQQAKFRFVTPMKFNTGVVVTADDVLNQFKNEPSLKITTDALPLNEYLHYVLGAQLSVSYILADDVERDTQSVSLNLQNTISQKKLFTLTEELLAQRDYIIRFDDGIFYIHKAGSVSGQGDIVFGYGKSVNSVPKTSLEIYQMVPFEYGMQVSLANTLRQLLGIKAIPDVPTNSLRLQGKRRDILRALELIRIFDQPTFKNRQIGIFKAAFLTTAEIITKLTDLLAQEGITVGTSPKLALSVVELDKQGDIIFFANNIQIIERAVFWAQQIDKPITSAEKQYFIYQPSYSRAVDMGESLSALIGGGKGLGSSTSAEQQNASSSINGNERVHSASSSTMKMVVDERANAIIFFTSGDEYQQILPLIKRLDILPKQIMLEVVIAEITLSDKFASGVDFTLTNQGDATKIGGFNLEQTAKSGLSYVLSGTKGKITATLSQTNDDVNILSRPSLLVRDGVTATISVGDDLPTVGETVVDNGISSSSVIYRKTGVNLKVKPTVNARGVIIMEIDQKISSEAKANASVAGSPIIFERTISTEVIAESGQTIVLGGLMSESRTLNETSVPFFSSIPLLGKLFDTNSDLKNKTELVVLVTPRVIESSEEWQDIKAKFLATFDGLSVQ